jgi:predicted dehydrogenase
MTIGGNGRFARRPAPERAITVGLVGLGYWGPNLLRVLIDTARARVGWMCDLDPDRLARFARRYPSVAATTRFEELLGDPAVNAVLVATPVHTHFELALRALDAGKHVFVEKPLAACPDEADQLVAAADDRELTLMCGHTFLYSPPVRAVKGLLESGELGDLYFISSSRVNLGLHQRDVSVLWDLGPHDFSILLYWLGEMPRTVSATGRDAIVPGIPDVAFVDLEFASGLIAHVELSWLAPSKLRRTAIVGSKKMVVYDDVSNEPIKVYDHGVVYEDPETFGQYHLSYRTGDVLAPKLDTAEPIALQLDDFVTAVTGGRPPVADVELARRVVLLAAAAEASLESGGTPVPVDNVRLDA